MIKRLGVEATGINVQCIEEDKCSASTFS